MKRYRLGCLALVLALFGVTGCVHQPYAQQSYRQQPHSNHHHSFHRTYVVPPNYVYGTPREVIRESYNVPAYSVPAYREYPAQRYQEYRVYRYGRYLEPSLGYPYSAY